MLVHENIEQGGYEWHSLRLGKITGSCFNKLMGTSEARKKYLYDRANEIVTGAKSDSDSFISLHIERGHEFEEIAVMKYTVTTLNEVQKVGFVQLDEFVGCSPDGLIGDDGMIEIKVPDSNNYFRQIIELNLKGKKAISKDHYAQMQFNMYVCKRQWCDYVLYNPAHEKNNKAIFIFRVVAEELEQRHIENTLTECVEEMKDLVSKYYAI